MVKHTTKDEAFRTAQTQADLTGRVHAIYRHPTLETAFYAVKAGTAAALSLSSSTAIHVESVHPAK